MKSLIDLSTKIFDIEDLFHSTGSAGAIRERNGCPYNMNRDTDKMCFKNALARFIRTGAREDAFDVFFCYFEIFKPFGTYKEGIDTLLDLLHQHESYGASLLTKHRDHYSHSVYVFALGLAIFLNNDNVYRAVANLYGEDHIYEKFLKYWGMAGLFHDIGYPYEIAFLQIFQYGEKVDNGNESSRLRINYANLDGFLALTDEEIKRCGEFLPKGANNLNALFASQILSSFGLLTQNYEHDLQTVENCLSERITNADEYMDHGYFSAVLFLKKLLKREAFFLEKITIDAVMAMLLHNSFYKRTYKNILGKKYEQIHLKNQPLAYLLMLCDELQCWDRIPYGELSKKQELAWDIDISVDNGGLQMRYYFDKGENQKDIDKIAGLKAEIDSFVINTAELGAVNIYYDRKEKDKKVYNYLSEGNFINLCKIAETINISYMADCNNAGIKNYVQEEFDNLTLEYKLSNVAQAKHYVHHLEDINCFFSDRKLDYTTVEEFREDELEYLALNEHIRWVNEKVGMGWKYGIGYTREEREQKRIHCDIVPYNDLIADEKRKDYFPINNMIRHLRSYGIKVYRLDGKNKPQYILGCTGHRDLSRIDGFDEERVRGDVRSYLRKLKEKYSLKLFCGFGDGADLLFAEEALKCGVDLIAVLPCEWKEFMGEHEDGGVKFMQLLGQSKEVRVKPGTVHRYAEMSNYIVRQCDELMTLWDGKKLPFEDEAGDEINRGGTYDTILAAEKANKIIRRFI